MKLQFAKATKAAFWPTALVLACTAMVAGCGGGGSSSTAAATTSGSLTTAVTAPSLNDTYPGAFGGVDGLGGDAGGSADSGGAAGDGEFIQLSGRFPTGVATTNLTWTVLRSNYGLTTGKTGNTGTLTVQIDPVAANGGYKVTQVNGVASRATQANFFVSTAGLISGSLPLPIGTNGATVDALYNAMRLSDLSTPASATDFSAYAGDYMYAQLSSNTDTGANASINTGFIHIAADGTGRTCSNSAGIITPSNYLTCPGGLNFTTSYKAGFNQKVLEIASNPGQTVPAGYTNFFNALATAKSFTSGGVASMSMTGDAVMTQDGVNRTGAFYAAKITGSATVPNLAIGQWNFTSRNVNPSATNAGTVTVANVGGTIKVNVIAAGGTCQGASTTRAMTAGPVNGSLSLSVPPIGWAAAYAIPMDVDSAVFVAPGATGAELGIMRRFSASTTGSPCMPV
jgi:hypothetical protein